MIKYNYKENDLIGDNGVSYIADIGSKNNRKIAKLKCSCGSFFETYLSLIRSGQTKSCGCLVKKASSINLKDINKDSHGLSYHPLYAVWNNMKNRCYKESVPSFKNYGGRGITICDEWINDYPCFFDWAIQNNWKNGLQIDREDNSGNYNPVNCRFVTAKINARNKRARANSKSGISGITTRGVYWRARIRVDKKDISLGQYSDFFEACCARKRAENLYWK